MIRELEIVRPDDWHLHLRDGTILKAVLPYTSETFGRAIVMPNLTPPIKNVKEAILYKNRISAACPDNHNFQPLMTIYLTESTDAMDIAEGFSRKLISAVKLYPAGATTNSSQGVNNFKKLYKVFEKMEEIGCPLCVHGEVVDPQVDIFDREYVFIDKVLDPIIRTFPNLKIVLEHITTQEAVNYVKTSRKNIAATITTHHLVINRNFILAGGIKPHYYCLPVAKRENHRIALLNAAASGNSSFFLGTDSAPHFDEQKESACGCAGCFTALNTIPILAQLFEQEGSLEKLENFTSINGANFYNLPLNSERIKLIKEKDPIEFPNKVFTPEGEITVFDPGFPVSWSVKSI